MRNIRKYTKLYSGAEPEFIEGDMFETIIPLTTGSLTKVGPGTSLSEQVAKLVAKLMAKLSTQAVRKLKTPTMIRP